MREGARQAAWVRSPAGAQRLGGERLGLRRCMVRAVATDAVRQPAACEGAPPRELRSAAATPHPAPARASSVVTSPTSLPRAQPRRADCSRTPAQRNRFPRRAWLPLLLPPLDAARLARPLLGTGVAAKGAGGMRLHECVRALPRKAPHQPRRGRCAQGHVWALRALVTLLPPRDALRSTCAALASGDCASSATAQPWRVLLCAGGRGCLCASLAAWTPGSGVGRSRPAARRGMRLQRRRRRRRRRCRSTAQAQRQEVARGGSGGARGGFGARGCALRLEGRVGLWGRRVGGWAGPTRRAGGLGAGGRPTWASGAPRGGHLAGRLSDSRALPSEDCASRLFFPSSLSPLTTRLQRPFIGFGWCT